MTDIDVGSSEGASITIDLSGTQVRELSRWAKIGRRSIEETVLAAIDEYIYPIETEAHGRRPDGSYQLSDTR